MARVSYVDVLVHVCLPGHIDLEPQDKENILHQSSKGLAKGCLGQDHILDMAVAAQML